jgi:UDP-N-acetylenolpyruvoylglucosamine reductase
LYIKKQTKKNKENRKKNPKNPNPLGCFFLNPGFFQPCLQGGGRIPGLLQRGGAHLPREREVPLAPGDQETSSGRAHRALRLYGESQVQGLNDFACPMVK